MNRLSLVLIAGGCVIWLASSGCRSQSSQLIECQAARKELTTRLAEEQRLRGESETQLRQAMARLAESEKQLARHYRDGLADLPAGGFVGAAVDGSAAPSTNAGTTVARPASGGPLEASGWRPSRMTPGSP